MKSKKLIKNASRVEVERPISNKPLPTFNPRRLDKINYNRTKLQMLSEYQMPFIVTATLEAISDMHYTFIDVKPFIEKIDSYRIENLCNHINLRIKDILQYIDISELQIGMNVFLFCNTKTYYSKYNEKRFGLELSDIIKCPILFTKEQVLDIPENLYMHFTSDVLTKLKIRIQPPSF